jgi:malonate decarboxylase delta subunit
LNAANAARAAHASPGGAEAARSTIGVSDVVCGVAASGNLEILVEALNPALPGTRCVIEVHSAAEGFRETWSAVLHDFVGRHPAGGLRFTLNDVGATPAVVALRLAQAHEGWCAALPDAAP